MLSATPHPKPCPHASYMLHTYILVITSCHSSLQDRLKATPSCIASHMRKIPAPTYTKPIRSNKIFGTPDLRRDKFSSYIHSSQQSLLLGS